MSDVSRRGWAASRLVQAIFLLSVLGAWYFASRAGRVSSLLLPNPVGVWHQLVYLVVSGDFLEPLRITLYAVVVAFAIAAIAGLFVGYLISRSRYLVRVFDPLFASLYAIPTILFFPLYVLLFGVDTGSKIAFGATASFFPIVLNTVAGFAVADRALIAAARSMGASNRQMFRHVLWPSAAPVVLAGIRMGIIVAFLAVLGGETIASLGGLGYAVNNSSMTMDTETMYAYIVIVVLLASVLNFALAHLERRTGWTQRTAGDD